MYKLEKFDDYINYIDKNEDIELKLSNDYFFDFINPKDPDAIEDFTEIQKAFDHPIDSEPLHVLAKGKENIVIIVSDSTRGIPTSEILPFVIKELELGGISYDKITIIVALGVHRDATQEEIEEIIGSEYYGKINAINHNAFDYNQLVNIGITSRGTPIEINKTVYEADLKIIIGKVEPHEFAGFSGGRKSILPGIASEKTIEINHRPEMLLDPNSAPGIFVDNQINMDMEEAARCANVDFNVSLVLNKDAKVIKIFCGDLFATQERSIEYLRAHFGIKSDEKADIVITTPGEPFNIDFYQSIKAIIGASPFVKDDGVIFIYSKCKEGVNSPDMLKAFKSAEDIPGVLKYLEENYKIQMDHTLLLSKILQRGVQIVLSSENVSEEECLHMFIEYASSIEDGLNRSFELVNIENPKVLIFPQPHRYLPE